MSEILQEMWQLKQNQSFVRNLGWTLVITLAFCLSLAEVQTSPSRLGKQARIAQFSQTVSAGVVVKIYQNNF
ncbi:MAG: hypothetical protein ACFCU5_17570 [Pleurocapsa sp.]